MVASLGAHQAPNHPLLSTINVLEGAPNGWWNLKNKMGKVSPHLTPVRDFFLAELVSNVGLKFLPFLRKRDFKEPDSSITWRFPRNFQQHPTESSFFMFKFLIQNSCFVQPCQIYRSAVTVFSATFWTIDFILAFFVGYYVSGSLEPCNDRKKCWGPTRWCAGRAWISINWGPHVSKDDAFSLGCAGL